LQSYVVVTNRLCPIDATPRVSNLAGKISPAYVTDTANQVVTGMLCPSGATSRVSNLEENQVLINSEYVTDTPIEQSSDESSDESINQCIQNNNVTMQKISQATSDEKNTSKVHVKTKNKGKTTRTIAKNNNQRINEVLQCVMIKNKKLIINQLQFNLKQIIDDKNIHVFCLENKNHNICRLRFNHNSIYNALFIMLMHWNIETTVNNKYHLPTYIANLITIKIFELLHLKTKWLEEAFARYTNCTTYTQMRKYARSLKKENTEGNMLSILVFCSILNAHVKVSYTDENDNYCCISSEKIFDSFTSRPSFDIKYSGNIGYTLKHPAHLENSTISTRKNYFYFSDEKEYMKYITKNTKICYWRIIIANARKIKVTRQIFYEET